VSLTVAPRSPICSDCPRSIGIVGGIECDECDLMHPVAKTDLPTVTPIAGFDFSLIDQKTGEVSAAFWPTELRGSPNYVIAILEGAAQSLKNLVERNPEMYAVKKPDTP
jgi:hypothetical protein